MQTEVKLGLILGVIVLLILGVFWVSRSDETALRPDAYMSDAQPVESVGQTVPMDRTGAATAIEEVAPSEKTLNAIRDLTGQPIVRATEEKPKAVASPLTPKPVAPSGQRYVVKPNDRLWTIAEKHYGSGKHWKLIYAANKDRLPDKDLLPVGTVLILPLVSKSAPLSLPAAKTPAPGKRTHRVAKGETLSDIAEKYYGKRSEWQRLREANKETVPDPDNLKIGQVLVIPEP